MRPVFEYDDGNFSLILQQRVGAAVSGFGLHPAMRQGECVEVQGRDGGMLSRVPIRPGMAGGAVASPERAGHPITRTGSGRTNLASAGSGAEHAAATGGTGPPSIMAKAVRATLKSDWAGNASTTVPTMASPGWFQLGIT